MKKGNKPIINYIFLIIIVIMVIMICAYIIEMYNLQKEKNKKAAIITKYINEIKINELNDYIVENEKSFIYICNPNIEKCNEFEKNIEKDISNSNIGEQLMYLDLYDIKNNSNNHIKNINKNNVPLLLVYNQNSIEEMVNLKTFEDIKNILIKYEVNYLND